MFERLKGLAGEWEGTFEWSQGRTGSGPLKARYELTGYGSALMETLIQGGAQTMTSIYHLDGADLRMTHYCAARNQPRLKVTRIDEAAGSVEFSFVDLTSGNGPDRGHVEGVFLHILDADHLNIKFIFGGGPGSGVENILVKRVGSKTAQQ